MFKPFAVIAVGALLIGCPSPRDEGDGGPDAAVRDGKLDAPQMGDGGTCPTPADTTGYVPTRMPAPTGKHQNKCTPADLAAYHNCLFNQDSAACALVQDVAFTACLDCLQGHTMGSTWGPIYCDAPMVCFPNQQGCLDLALDQEGPMACGELLHADSGCVRFACASCGDDPSRFNQCAQSALMGTCQKYHAAFVAQCQQYLNVDPDSGFPDVANCFRLQGEMDGRGLQERIDAYFCGP